MQSLVALLGLAIALFASTNVDDLFVLLGFFSDPKLRTRDIYSSGIVMGKVYARADADFENCPFSQGDNPLAHIADGLWI
jgi:hypothetical protein